MRYILGLLALVAVLCPLSAFSDVPIRQYPVCDQSGLPEIVRWIKEMDRDDMRLVVLDQDQVAKVHKQLLYDLPDASAVLDGLDFIIGYEMHDDGKDLFIAKLFVRGCPIGDAWFLTDWLFSNLPAYPPEAGQDI